MCCSFWPIKFSRTITGTWEVLVDGLLQHVIWYQNNVGEGRQSNSIADQIFEGIVRYALNGFDWKEACADPMAVNNIQHFTVEQEVAHRQAGGNPRSLSRIYEEYAMPDLNEGDGNCLIVPLLGTWQSIKLLNTTDVPNILDDISDALMEPVHAPAPAGTGYGGGGGGIVFLQFSIYDIIIAENASSLASALAPINPLKRPIVNDQVFDTLESWYRCRPSVPAPCPASVKQ